MSDRATFHALVAVITAIAVVGLVRSALMARSHRQVGEFVTRVVVAAVLVVAAVVVVVAI